MIETPHLFPVKDHLHESDTVVHRIIKGKRPIKVSSVQRIQKGGNSARRGKTNPMLLG
jgi:hypothetical protein